MYTISRYSPDHCCNTYCQQYPDHCTGEVDQYVFHIAGTSREALDEFIRHSGTEKAEQDHEHRIPPQYGFQADHQSSRTASQDTEFYPVGQFACEFVERFLLHLIFRVYDRLDHFRYTAALGVGYLAVLQGVVEDESGNQDGQCKEYEDETVFMESVGFIEFFMEFLIHILRYLPCIYIIMFILVLCKVN